MTQPLPAPYPRLTLFAVATLLPLPLLVLAVAWGGFWVAGPLLYMSLLSFTLDQMIAHVTPDAQEGAEFPGNEALLTLLALGHGIALPALVWAIAGDSGLSGLARAALFAGGGLWFGQVANPCAHELIHRSDRRLFALGAAIYVSLLFGHHASAHRLVHHVHAASPQDPNTARAGEGFYRFAARAWAGSFRKGWHAERRRHGRRRHPYWVYLAGSACCLALAWTIAGVAGLVVWCGLALHAQSQLLLADYVQHYGLMRRIQGDGRPEPVAGRHSWNTPHWFSSWLMLNAPRHSDHHAHPARPYPALRLPDAQAAPQLPYPLPFCCLLALAPPLWRRVIHPVLKPWRQTAEKPLSQPINQA
jgi:alkane 1-monooxygenase